MRASWAARVPNIRDHRTCHETRDVNYVLALRLRCVLEVRDAKAARARLCRPIDNTLVESFTVARARSAKDQR